MKDFRTSLKKVVKEKIYLNWSHVIILTFNANQVNFCSDTFSRRRPAQDVKRRRLHQDNATFSRHIIRPLSKTVKRSVLLNSLFLLVLRFPQVSFFRFWSDSKMAYTLKLVIILMVPIPVIYVI